MLRAVATGKETQKSDSVLRRSGLPPHHTVSGIYNYSVLTQRRAKLFDFPMVSNGLGLRLP